MSRLKTNSFWRKLKRIPSRICDYCTAYCTGWGWRTYFRRDSGAWELVRFPRGEKWHKPFCADPFLFVHDEKIYLFYETTNPEGKGLIGCFCNAGDGWKQLGAVLEQPWHLSYPQVFEEDGHIYMIPEQSDLGKGNVTLYEATDFPRGWTPKAKLIDRPFADATLLRKDGYYYLSCYTIPPHETAELWCAPSLLGPWKQHPESSNINQSNRLRRCGGAFVRRDGKLYRVAQDCNGDYGKRVFLVEVLEVTPTTYREGKATLLLEQKMHPKGKKHTYNETLFGETVISVIDLQHNYLKRVDTIVMRIFSRIKQKIGRAK